MVGVELELDEESTKAVAEAVSERGIIFEDQVDVKLNEIFRDNWNVSSNTCFRQFPINESFNDRFEIDFIVRRQSPFKPTICDQDLNSRPYTFDPHLLIEAKSCSYDWCFFKSNSLDQIDDFYTFIDQELNRKRTTEFFPVARGLKVKRSIQMRFDKNRVVLKKHGKIQSCEEDIARKSVRQLAKNIQTYLCDIEDEKPDKNVIPIIVTNSKLKVFECENLSSGRYQEFSHLFFELDDFLFWKGEKVQTRVVDKNGMNPLKSFSKFHVWIVNIDGLDAFLSSIVHKKLLNR